MLKWLFGIDLSCLDIQPWRIICPQYVMHLGASLIMMKHYKKWFNRLFRSCQNLQSHQQNSSSPSLRCPRDNVSISCECDCIKVWRGTEWTLWYCMTPNSPRHRLLLFAELGTVSFSWFVSAQKLIQQFLSYRWCCAAITLGGFPP